jgi:hypothetical protein
MESNFGTQSGLARVLAGVAAVTATAGLFTAVALGLTGDGEWGVFAQQLDAAPQLQAVATA